MIRNNDDTNISEKNRIRDEIDAQIREYLQRGGKIDVLTGNQDSRRRAVGCVWHGPEDTSGLGA